MQEAINKASVLIEAMPYIQGYCDKIVVVKLGGVGMTPYGSGWAERGKVATSDEIVEAWGPAMHHIIDKFGVKRCMFESNFPVDKVSFSYRTMWNAYKKMTTGMSKADRDELFAATAERVYRI